MRGRNGADPVSRNLSLANDDIVDVVSEPSDSKMMLGHAPFCHGQV